MRAARGSAHQVVQPRITAAIAAGLMAAVLAIAPSSAATVVPWIAPDLAAALASPDLLQDAIEQDLRYRRNFGLDARPEYVQYLYDNPGETVGTRFAGALLTQAEWDEMHARNELSADSHLVSEYYRSRPELAADFGGILIDHKAGGVLGVYLRAGAARPWQGSLAFPERLDIRSAKVGLAHLEALRARVVSASATDPRAAAVTDTRLDFEAGDVVVGFRPEALSGYAPGALPSDFAAAMGAAHLRSEPVPELHEQGAAEYIGGRRHVTELVDDEYSCSFGFKVRRVGVTDYHFALTAGHCFDAVGDVVYRNTDPYNTRIGEVRGRRFYDGAYGDLALLRLDQGHTMRSYVRHVRSGEAYKLQVAGLFTNYGLGDKVCITGYKGGTECGPITDTSVPSTYEEQSPDVTINGMVKVGDRDNPVVVLKGDSGGPVYKLAFESGLVYAAGIQGSRGPDCPTKCHYAKFTPLKYIPGDWDVFVDYDSDPDPCTPGDPGDPCLLDDGDDGT